MMGFFKKNMLCTLPGKSDIVRVMTINFETFVRTRHAMWLEKSYGVPIETHLSDLTAYDLMRGHRYTNVWRELDRGTLELAGIQEHYGKFGSTTTVVYHTLLYRFFNSYSGYIRFIMAVVDADEMIESPTEATINAVLDQSGNFSGAYIRTIQRKIAIKALQNMWLHAEEIARLIDLHAGVALNSMWDEPTNILHELRKELRASLGAVPSFGDFLADQLMLDFCGQGNKWGLSFTPGLGPGAKRGLERTGMSFQDAIDAGNRGLAGMPVPTVKISILAPEHAVHFDAVEAEHQLCEAEKLWKIIDAADEGTGRQVKMRKYTDEVKPKLDAVIPSTWHMDAVK